MTEKKAVIIGAGLTGLTTAFYLKKAGWEVKIFERNNRAGGSIFTHREQGFVFESGPNTGLVSHPDVADLLTQLTGHIQIEPLGESVRRRLVWKDCRWYALPHCLSDSLRTPLFKWNEKLKLLMGTMRNNQYITEQFTAGKNTRPEHTVDPFIHAIYSGDFNGLLTKPNQHKNNKKEAIISSRLKNEKRNVKIDRQLFFINGGLDNLVKALIKSIGEDAFYFGTESMQVYPKEKGFSIQYKSEGHLWNLEVPVVISTIGASGIGKTFPFLNAHEKDLINNVSHTHVIQAVAGFNKWRGIPLKAFGGLVPNTENRNILGILFPSSFLKNRAPEQGALLSLFLGGVHNPDMISMPDETIKKMVMDELRCMLLTPEEPDLFKIFRHHYAFPLYGDNPDTRLETIINIEKQFPGLVLAGNMRDGIGMAHRIGQGAAIARNLTIQQS